MTSSNTSPEQRIVVEIDLTSIRHYYSTLSTKTLIFEKILTFIWLVLCSCCAFHASLAGLLALSSLGILLSLVFVIPRSVISLKRNLKLEKMGTPEGDFENILCLAVELYRCVPIIIIYILSLVVYLNEYYNEDNFFTVIHYTSIIGMIIATMDVARIKLHSKVSKE